MRKLDDITPIEENFGRWFEDVVTKGDLIEYGPVKGTIAFKPIAYGIWENIQKEMNMIFKKQDIQNVYLPLLIPKWMINKEKEHIKGFAPELATITKIGESELVDEIVIRPTSEMLFGELFKKEVHSYNDLPIIYNQWANVVRWEKTTNPFLRNTEFLWQEGHSCHSSAIEARRITKKMIKLYEKFLKDYLAIPTIMGRKTKFEKFAGAITTYTLEAMMKDGKALQVATSHYLGQNFSKAINIKFTNQENEGELVYQTSWGVSTRLIGAIIMSHGDNRGIIIPPKVAPYQIDILEVFAHKWDRVHKEALNIKRKLGRRFSVRLDDSTKNIGFKAARSEIQGTPIRIEIGPRDLENNEVTLVRRDTLQKRQVQLEDIKDEVIFLLQDIHDNLLFRATERLDKDIVRVNTYEEFQEAVRQHKFVLVPFAGSAHEERLIKEETYATSRCIPLNYKLETKSICFFTNKPTKRLVIFARSY